MRNFVFYVSLILSVVIGIAYEAFGETTVSAVVASEGAGFDAGIGLDAEWLGRWDRFGLDFSGDLLAQKKHSADSGYKWGVDGQVRWYPAGDFYIAPGIAWAGYDSEFDSGSNWRKDAIWPTIGIGYDGHIVDAWLTYYIKETQTPNETEALKIGLSSLLGEHWVIIGALAYVKYDQGGARESDLTGTLGIGWRFM